MSCAGRITLPTNPPIDVCIPEIPVIRLIWPPEDPRIRLKDLFEVIGRDGDVLAHIDGPDLHGGAWSRDLTRMLHLNQAVEAIEDMEIRARVQDVLTGITEAMVDTAGHGSRLRREELSGSRAA